VLAAPCSLPVFFDRQRFFVPAFGGLKIALPLRRYSQLVIGARGAVFVALFFFDRQRFFVPAFGGV